jgi:hypothetical protein
MKRSEMLNEIKATIRACSYLYEWYNGHISYGRMAERIAENILKHIEEKGMRPPFIEKNVTVETENLYGEKNGTVEYSYLLYEWEDEHAREVYEQKHS